MQEGKVTGLVTKEQQDTPYSRSARRRGVWKMEDRKEDFLRLSCHCLMLFMRDNRRL